MTEGLGMTGMTETPVVIMLAQRPGPSTGLPTYSGQGDLRFVIHASHGEFPRVVIAPGDVEECFYKTVEAFNLAEKFQIPAILITDKYLVESHGAAEPFDQSRIGIDRGLLLTEDEYRGGEEYKRHKLTDDDASSIILDRRGKNFRGRSTVAVNQYGQGAVPGHAGFRVFFRAHATRAVAHLHHGSPTWHVIDFEPFSWVSRWNMWSHAGANWRGSVRM